MYGGARTSGTIVLCTEFFDGRTQSLTKQTVAYASAQGTPLASIGVPLTGVIALLGGLSILLGYRVKIGASAITLKTRKSGSAMGTLIRAEFGHEIPGNRC
jgi:uncharacterized membrane protein YphA (DoxX/SURF4 family)